MRQGVPADPVSPPSGMMAASVENKGADRWMCRARMRLIYFLILVGAVVIWWTFREHYLAGYDFAPSSRTGLMWGIRFD